MAAGMGAQAQFGAGSADPVTEKYELVSGDIRATDEHVRSNGITGTRSHFAARTRAGLKRVSGDFTLHPNVDELITWMPRVMGASSVLAETIDAWVASIDKVTKVMVYSGMMVSKATFSGQAGGPLTMALQVEGTDVTVNSAGTFPSLTISTVPHFMFHDCVISVGGTTYRFKSWQLEIDNVPDAERFLNSRTRISIPLKDRIVNVTLDAPYGDNSALYALGTTGARVICTFTNGSDIAVFDNVLVQFPLDEPALNGKEEIMLPLRGQAGKSGSTAELVVTLTT